MAQRVMISSIVLFFSRAIDEVGPAVEALKAGLAPVADCGAVLSVDVAVFEAPPNNEAPVGAVVVVAVVVAPEAGVAPEAVAPVLGAVVAAGVLPAAEVEVAPKRLDAVLTGSVVAALEAGFPKPENIEVGCVFCGSDVVGVPEGLLEFEKSALACVAVGAVEADVLAGVDEVLPRPENNPEDEPADVVGVALAPPKRAADLAAGASAGLGVCCPKSEVVAAGAVLLLCVVAGFDPKRLEVEELSAGFAPPKRFEGWLEAWPALAKREEVPEAEDAGWFVAAPACEPPAVLNRSLDWFCLSPC